MNQKYENFVEANQWLGQPEILREKLQENGYLFFRQIVPRDVVLQARHDILEVCREAGWVVGDSGTLMEGKWSGLGPFTENEPEYMAVYRQVLRLPSFNAVPESSSILKLVGQIIGEPITVHRRKIGRITFPQNVAQTTATHQDWHYVRGTPETYTLWTPLGDCPRELSGLAVLQGSHKQGYLEHTEFEGKKYAAAGLADTDIPQGENIEWHAADFQAGDGVFFHSHTIHKALPNLTPDRIRLSTDNRYQLSGSAIEPGSMGSHYNL